MKSLPTTYRGIRYRSRLEARWAEAFDEAGVVHSYEDEGWRFGPDLCYLPDFFLPELRTIVEVKGVLDPRSEAKLEALHEVADLNRVLVVLAESPPGRRWARVTIEGLDYFDGFDICPECHRRQFFDAGGCRVCPRTARTWEPPYSEGQWRDVCRWWAREMVRAGRMDDAAAFLEAAVDEVVY